MKVIKVGGGCLKDGPAAKKIIELIAQRGQGDIFVLSAFYGVTDILINGIEKALENEEDIVQVMSQIRTLHNTVIKTLIPDNTKRKQLSRELSVIFQRLERYYYGVSFTREATPRMKDMIATCGERISAVILSKTMTSMGQKSCYLLPEEVGIISDGKFMDASAIMAKTARNLSAAVEKKSDQRDDLFYPRILWDQRIRRNHHLRPGRFRLFCGCGGGIGQGGCP